MPPVDTRIPAMTLKHSLMLLFREVATFTKGDFHLLSYVYTAVFIFASILLNYSTGFYVAVMRPSYFTGDSMWAFPLFYGAMYFAVAVPVLLIQKDYKLLRNSRFYLKSLFFIVLYGMTIGYFGYTGWEFPEMFAEERMFVMKIISQLKGSILFIIPLLIMKLSIDRNVTGLYGLCRNTSHIPAYIVLFLMLLPFLVAMSFTSDFQVAYPQYQPWAYADIFSLPLWLNTLLYEIAYGIDFIKTELVFRGLLVIGMIGIMGRKAVLPMVAMYVAIHFGKPLGETISSAFGGYILGALAYQTLHIWGGVIVHICIALAMEVMGFVQYYLLNERITN